MEKIALDNRILIIDSTSTKNPVGIQVTITSEQVNASFEIPEITSYSIEHTYKNKSKCVTKIKEESSSLADQCRKVARLLQTYANSLDNLDTSQLEGKLITYGVELEDSQPKRIIQNPNDKRRGKAQSKAQRKIRSTSKVKEAKKRDKKKAKKKVKFEFTDSDFKGE